MTPFQQLYLGLGASKKTYLDDVFSTQVYHGTGSAKTITTGINLSGEGGAILTKRRDSSTGGGPWFNDTARGITKYIATSSNADEYDNSINITAVSSTGYSVGTHSGYNNSDSGSKHASWTFRKAPGFFDVVTWTGNGSNRTISHSLGSIPGMIFIKRTNNASDWIVYNQALDSSPEDYLLNLNTNAAKASAASTYFQSTAPTSSVFSLGSSANVNGDGFTYVAYVFAGGESTAATARSVDFDGTGDYLKFEASSSGIAVGTGNFTCEFWVKLNDDVSGNDALIDTRSSGSASDGFQIYLGSNRAVYGYVQGDMFGGTTKILNVGTWHHIAVVRPATNVIRLYVDGTRVGNQYGGDMTFSNSEMVVAANDNGSTETNCKISNLRLTKGQALYTSSFRPPTEPLTTTSQGATASNVKILACNNSSVTGGTVVPATVNTGGNPTASTDSPFDDPAAFTFGENGDQGIIKCGSYIGNGSSTGPKINLGWEPQYILLKNADEEEQWQLFDSMRGITTGGNDEKLMPSSTSNATTTADIIDLTPTGFNLKTSDTDYNGNNDKIIYMAIRRPDGYVGKPAEAGTDVFTTVVGNSSSTIPAAVSGFPVDLAIYKTPASADSWVLSTRLTAGKYVSTDLNAAEGNLSDSVFDSNSGWYKGSYFNSNYQAYMWTRHAGFDVVTYDGTGALHDIPHSMNQVPEMIWTKRLDTTANWHVYHKDMNSGTNAWSYYMHLNTSSLEGAANVWNNTPTSNTFTITANAGAPNGSRNIAMLFSSVSGISSVGSYTGNNSSSGPTVTTGFSPRFILIKRSDVTSDNWFIFDTVRGINNSGNDARLKLDESGAQTNSADWLSISSTGFTLNTTDGGVNASSNYLYYAHA